MFQFYFKNGVEFLKMSNKILTKRWNQNYKNLGLKLIIHVYINIYIWQFQRHQSFSEFDKRIFSRKVASRLVMTRAGFDTRTGKSLHFKMWFSKHKYVKKQPEHGGTVPQLPWVSCTKQLHFKYLFFPVKRYWWRAAVKHSLVSDLSPLQIMMLFGFF